MFRSITQANVTPTKVIVALVFDYQIVTFTKNWAVVVIVHDRLAFVLFLQFKEFYGIVYDCEEEGTIFLINFVG